jgi:hypothetical protein
MCPSPRLQGLSLLVVGGLLLLAPASQARADEPALTPQVQNSKEDEVPTYNLLDALRDGIVSVNAEGIGDGRMILSVTNKTKRQLRVVLPPGLIASGTTGQFGGMGGMGGFGGMGGLGMGSMGGMGGLGMGGMGLGGMGMGGMGMGGLGGMGTGGFGGLGSTGMGGMGMMGGGTMPASMGMMMLGQLIMSLIGDRDSWDQRSLMMGLGGMGLSGMGMGGLGGMGGMGGSFRSVPPTSLPFANLKSGQTRNLPTRLVSLSEPDPEQPVALPAKGEKLKIGDISQVTKDERVQKAWKRLAEDKAPLTVAQVVLWRVKDGLGWDEIGRMAKDFVNTYELTLARHFIEQLDNLPAGDTGALLFEVSAADEANRAVAEALGKLLQEKSVLGLPTKAGVPTRPEGPAVACRLQIVGTAAKPEAQVQVAKTDATATAWVAVGKFTLPVAREKGELKGVEFADALAGEILGRLVRAQLSKGPMVKGKQVYKVQIDNASPLILNGLAVLGVRPKEGEPPKVLSGISIAPFKKMTVPATGELVDQLGLRKGVRVIAADLSGL